MRRAAHSRRKFVDAEDVEPDRADRALAFILGIYAVEQEIRDGGLEAAKKLEVRVAPSRPVMTKLLGWLKEEPIRCALLPTKPFTVAARHALKLKAPLEVFLSDSAVPVDANHLERALRSIPMGRKAWLFCWTEVGAEKVGVIQSLL